MCEVCATALIAEPTLKISKHDKIIEFNKKNFTERKKNIEHVLPAQQVFSSSAKDQMNVL